jgi:hypothetical protein
VTPALFPRGSFVAARPVCGGSAPASAGPLWVAVVEMPPGTRGRRRGIRRLLTDRNITLPAILW